MTNNLTTKVGDVISDLYSTVGELGGELRQWHDNMPENLQSGTKGQEVEAAAEALEAVSEIDVPSEVVDLEVKLPPPSKNKKLSRAKRMANVVACARIALDSVQSWVENERADNEDNDEFDNEPVEEIETFVGDMNDQLDELDNIEFPSWR